MNLDQLRASIEKNKKPLAIAGAAGVAGLALLNKRGKGEEQPAAAGATVAGLGSGAQYGLTGSAGAYDSSSSDVYNAIQPQLESLGQKQGSLEQLLEKLLATPAPVPVQAPPTAKPATPAPKPTAPAPAPRVYTVRPGDNLTKIARNLGVPSWRVLYDRNRSVVGGNPNLIRPGQRLTY